MDLRDLNNRISKLLARTGAARGAPLLVMLNRIDGPGAGAGPWPRVAWRNSAQICIQWRVSDGFPSDADLARLLDGLGGEDMRGGVMFVPLYGDGSVDDWEKVSVESQRRLKADVRL